MKKWIGGFLVAAAAAGALWFLLKDTLFRSSFQEDFTSGD